MTLRSSVDKEKGPFLDVKLNYSTDSHFKISGFLSVLDILKAEVYGIADYQGITFYSIVEIKICGLNFIESSFLFRAGLLKI